MKKEIFDLTVDGIIYTVKTDLPVGPGNDDHEIWKGNDLLFVMNPHTENCDDPCWKLTPIYEKAGIDKEFISKVGEAIERHYL